MSDAQKKQLKEIDAQIELLKITVESASVNPHYTSMRHKGTAASLCIPNKLYLLWDRRNKLQAKLGASVLKLSAMANDSIKGKILTLDTDEDSVETRLATESCRCLYS